MWCRCCVKGCNNTNNINCRPPNVFFDGKFVRMPKEPKRLKAWNEILQLSGDRHRYVCGIHFDESAWRTQDIIMNVTPKLRKLKADAVPRLKLPDHNTINGEIQETELPKDAMEETSKGTHKPAMDENTRKKEVRTEQVMMLPILASDEGSNSCTQFSEKEAQININENDEPSAENPLENVYNNICMEKTTRAEASVAKHKCGEIIVEEAESLTFELQCSHCCALFYDFNVFKLHFKTMHSKLGEQESKKSVSSEAPVAVAMTKPMLVESLPELLHVKRSVSGRSPIREQTTKDARLQQCKAHAHSSIFANVHNSIFELIELYEQTPNLWKITEPNYSSKLQHKNSLESLYDRMSTTLRKELVNSKEALIRVLTDLNTWFSAEKNLRMNAKQTSQNYTSRYPQYYEALSFLENHVPPFACEICERIYVQEKSYLRHLDPERSTRCARRFRGVYYVCDFCGMRFDRSLSLKCHRRQHTNERPYQCHQCDVKFRNQSTLKRHQWTHTAVKPYKCDNCERAYYTKYLLKMHQKTHLNIRDVMCDICGKSFTLRKYLRRHKDALHTTDADWTCKICGGIFKAKQKLMNHIKLCKLTERNVGVIKSPTTVEYRNASDAIRIGYTFEEIATPQAHQVKTIVRAD